MKRILLLLASVIYATTSMAAYAQVKLSIPLPSDPSTVIMTLDWHGTGGMIGRTTPLKFTGPSLIIRADGSTTATNRANDSEIQGTLSQADLQQMIQSAVNDQDFFMLNGTDIQKAIAAEQARVGYREAIFDDSDTIIHIKTADNDHEVRFYALRFYAQRYPTIKSLGQLHAVSKMLERTYLELMAGGKSEITKALGQANTYMKQQDGSFLPLSPDDLFTAESSNGRTKIAFLRDLRNGKNIVVTVVQSPNEQAKITSQVYSN